MSEKKQKKHPRGNIFFSQKNEWIIKKIEQYQDDNILPSWNSAVIQLLWKGLKSEGYENTNKTDASD